MTAPAVSRSSTGYRPASPARWLVPLSMLLALAGLAIAVYLTVEHYTGNSTLACSATATVDCLKVTTSPQSVILGVPVAVYGLAFFAVLTGLVTPPAWRAASVWPHRARLAMLGVGMASVLYLVYVELFQVDAICLWCTGVHAITFVLFCLVVLVAPRGLRPAAE